MTSAKTAVASAKTAMAPAAAAATTSVRRHHRPAAKELVEKLVAARAMLARMAKADLLNNIDGVLFRSQRKRPTSNLRTSWRFRPGPIKFPQWFQGKKPRAPDRGGDQGVKAKAQRIKASCAHRA